MPLPLKADGRAPNLFAPGPVYAGDAACVIPANRFGTNHFHTRAVYVRQTCKSSWDAGLCPAAAAGGTAPLPEVQRGNGKFLSAVTAAQPGGSHPNIFRRSQHS